MSEIVENIKDSKRIVAIHAANDVCNDVVAHKAMNAMQIDAGDVVVFAPSSMMIPDTFVDKHKWISFPESSNSISKQKNFIIDWCKNFRFKGFLHIIEDSISLNLASKQYMNMLEATMSTLDYDVHFSTITDKCNYVFNKFCPRLSIDIDDDNIRKTLGLPSKICFTSHSNVSYVTYNFNAVGDCPPKFDERFTVGMYFIIEFLSRRRATKKDGQLYYMNQYLSIADEVGAYSIEDVKAKTIDNDVMQHENELFKSLNIDYAPDNNLDIVLDTLYVKLKEKMHDA